MAMVLWGTGSKHTRHSSGASARPSAVHSASAHLLFGHHNRWPRPQVAIDFECALRPNMPAVTSNAISIGELSRLSGLSPHTLRFYETEGILKPAGRTASGHRQYH